MYVGVCVHIEVIITTCVLLKCGLQLVIRLVLRGDIYALDVDLKILLAKI